MQSRIFPGIFALVWGGVCYVGGRIAEKESREDFTSQKKVIQTPQSTSEIKIKSLLASDPVVQNTFVDGLIEAPIRRINYPNFKILYSTYHKCPLAVHELVTKELADGDAPRRPTFFVEEGVEPQFRATNDHFVTPKAYKNFNFARGHMAAAGNYSGNKEAKYQTFTYANVVPQNQYNNGGIWNTFERYTRDLIMSEKCQNVQVISGPIFYKNNPYKGPNGQSFEKVFKEQSIVFLENGIMAPEKLYKIIKCNTKTGQTYIDAFEFWNKKTFDNDKPLSSFVAKMSSIQNQTGMKFNWRKDVVGKPAVLKSLIQFDKEGFSKQKKQYDLGFYMNMMKKSHSIDDLNNSFMRAKDQLIWIPLQQFRELTQSLFQKDIQQIKSNYSKDPKATACQTLNNLMKLNKSLFYLRQLNPQFQQKIQEVQESGPLTECLSKAYKLRSTQWQQLNASTAENIANEKKQKSGLNSVTYSITKAVQKTEGQKQGDIKVLRYINEQKLKQFIIPVNLATYLAGTSTTEQVV